jgi:hypothetical protein
VSRLPRSDDQADKVSICSSSASGEQIYSVATLSSFRNGVPKNIVLINHQKIVIGELVNINRDLTQRLEA